MNMAQFIKHMKTWPLSHVLRGAFQNRSGHWRRVKYRQLVMQSPLVRESLFPAAGDIENKVKQLPAHIFDCLFTRGDGACIDIHQVIPAVRQLGTRRHFNDRHRHQPVRRAASGGKDLYGNAGSDLLRAADEIAGGRRGVNQAAFGGALARRQYFDNGALTRFSDRAQRFFHDVRQAAFLLPGDGLALRSVFPISR